MADRRQEINDNLASFLQELPKLLPAYRGKFALLHHKRIIGFYDTVADAVNAAEALYHDKIFSIQEVTDRPFDSGFFSHALPLGKTQ